MPNLHPFAGEIKRHPEVETLLVTGDNRAEIVKDVLPISYVAVSKGQRSLMITESYGCITEVQVC
jgi:hypothetical protein